MSTSAWRLAARDGSSSEGSGSIGTDFLGIEERGAAGHPAHVELLTHGVTIVEGLDLGDVQPGAYRLTVLPLRIVDGDGGPARAVLEPEPADTA